jgi:hypothetical protein
MDGGRARRGEDEQLQDSLDFSLKVRLRAEFINDDNPPRFSRLNSWQCLVISLMVSQRMQRNAPTALPLVETQSSPPMFKPHQTIGATPAWMLTTLFAYTTPSLALV